MPETTAANALPPDDVASAPLSASTHNAAAGARSRVPLWAAAAATVLALLVGVAAGLAVSGRAVDKANTQRDQALAALALARDELKAAQQDLTDAREQLADQPPAGADCPQPPPDLGGLASYTPFAYGNGGTSAALAAVPATMPSAWLPST
jgi:hypothetical protein